MTDEKKVHTAALDLAPVGILLSDLLWSEILRIEEDGDPENLADATEVDRRSADYLSGRILRLVAPEILSRALAAMKIEGVIADGEVGPLVDPRAN